MGYTLRPTFGGHPRPCLWVNFSRLGFHPSLQTTRVRLPKQALSKGERSCCKRSLTLLPGSLAPAFCRTSHIFATMGKRLLSYPPLGKALILPA